MTNTQAIRKLLQEAQDLLLELPKNPQDAARVIDLSHRITSALMHPIRNCDLFSGGTSMHFVSMAHRATCPVDCDNVLTLPKDQWLLTAATDATIAWCEEQEKLGRKL